MSGSQPPPRREHPSTYFVQDRSSEDELKRLRLQDAMVTDVMGGVLAEQPDPHTIKRLLDVGCGTGGWLIDAARTYPEMKLLIGVDISASMLDYAREQAVQQGVSDRVEFHVMDALRMLEFPSQFFDLINQRLGTSYLRTWDWPKILQEYKRITRPRGVIRVTETDGFDDSTSENVNVFTQLFAQAFEKAGHVFSMEEGKLIGHLPVLLQQHGHLNVQTRSYTQVAQPDTEQGRLLIEDLKHIMKTGIPFVRKWCTLPDDYEARYQQALLDMQQPDFRASWTLLTAWGSNP